MNDVAVSTVELLLQFVYGCLKPELTLAEAVAMFEASDMYALTGLHQQCTRLLKALISFDNVFDLAELAQLHDCPTLLQVRTPDLLILLSNIFYAWFQHRVLPCRALPVAEALLARSAADHQPGDVVVPSMTYTQIRVLKACFSTLICIGVYSSAAKFA